MTHRCGQTGKDPFVMFRSGRVETRSSRQGRRADTRMYGTTHWLAAKHIAADAPIGLSATNREAPPALTSDFPSHFDRSFANAYYPTRHSCTSLSKCRKRHGVCADRTSARLLWHQTYVLFVQGNYTTIYSGVQAGTPHIWRRTDVLSGHGQHVAGADSAYVRPEKDC